MSHRGIDLSWQLFGPGFHLDLASPVNLSQAAILCCTVSHAEPPRCRLSSPQVESLRITNMARRADSNPRPMRGQTSEGPPTQPPREWFYELLFTWTILHPSSTKAPIDRKAIGLLPNRERERKCIELENRYGVGHYDERRTLLDTCLRLLEGNNKIDLGAVFNTLNEAFGEKGISFFEGRGLDAVRDLFDQRDLVLKQLRGWLSRAQRLYSRFYSEPLCDALQFTVYEKQAPAGVLDLQLALDGNPTDLPVLASLRSLIVAIDRDPLTNLEPPPRLRRPRRGHQPEPWLKTTRRKLAAAHVPRAIREDLLIAVGFVPYPSR